MESGGTEQAVEPKESLELKKGWRRRTILQESKGASSSSVVQVQGWCDAMSHVARTVNRVWLNLPPNVFLMEENDEDEEEESLDLLRVFYYHAVPGNDQTTIGSTVPDENDVDPPKHRRRLQLGSSPHTDWGSWTVVWQDDQGGLETYCRRCHKWIPVAPPTPSHNDDKNDTWDCIIHVGDMASLALGKEPSTSSSSTSSSSAEKEASGDTSSVVVQWPSPRHRVVSPSQGERTSLVYFAYPPPSCSIREMQDAVRRANHLATGRRLPLDEYYLLRDQQLSPVDTTSWKESAEAAYAKLQSRTIRQVVQEKWNQVQRS